MNIKVVHVPCITPYAKKIYSDNITIINGKTIRLNQKVPMRLTLEWVLSNQPLVWFDVLHLHHIEFEDLKNLEKMLDLCERYNKGVIYTVHDVKPIFESNTSYSSKVKLLAEGDTQFVGLTRSSLRDLRLHYDFEGTYIPHGYVLSPNQWEIINRKRKMSTRSNFLIFGSLRANRELLSVLISWRFSPALQASSMQVLLRAPSPRSFEEDKEIWFHLNLLAADERMQLFVHPFPSDEEIAQKVATADYLIIPYKWGSHSGQLELALDCNTVPIITDVGYYEEQVSVFSDNASIPLWVDWSDGEIYQYGYRMLKALEKAWSSKKKAKVSSIRRDFREFRIEEHNRLLAEYRDVYLQSLDK